MSSLKVPARFRVGILRLGNLTQAQFDELLSAVSKTPLCKDTRELLTWIGDETPSLTASQRHDIITVIVPMVRVQQNAEVSPEYFANDVWDSISSEDPNATENLEKQELTSRIVSLLSSSALDLPSSRIREAQTQVERNFCKAKVFTDLRPAFTSDLEEFPTDLAVIHNLQISYHLGRRATHKEFHISLDGADLAKLKKAILDAEKKAETLENMLSIKQIRLHK